jgi:hypothetical protein
MDPVITDINFILCNRFMMSPVILDLYFMLCDLCDVLYCMMHGPCDSCILFSFYVAGT